MKRKWTAYSTSIFALSKPFNKTGLMILLIAAMLYIVSGIVGSGGVTRASADEGIVSGVSADEGINSGVSADGMSNGKLAGIIRSTNHPCAKVIEFQPNGETSWAVKCNSGNFNVTRNANGEFNVYAF